MKKYPQMFSFAWILFLAISAWMGGGAAVASAQADDPNPPEEPVRLVFIHHSTGENWLQDGYGDLGAALDANRYFVSDTNYGWGPDSIGDRTDIVNWPEWFGPERSQRALDRLYAEDGQNAWWTRTLENPGGENEIILFKSCFPNSELGGSPNDPPSPGGYDTTVGSAKAIYNLLLDYFLSRPDKMFVAITAPPVSSGEHAANARAFNNWLVYDWLTGYTGSNVFVFDFYNVLSGPDNHHRFRDGQVEHVTAPGMDTLYYPSDDDHPNPEGSSKATEEFVPLLNVFYHRWKASAPVTQPAQQETAGQEPSQTPPGQAEEEAPAEQPPAPALDAGAVIVSFADNAGWESHTDGMGSSMTCSLVDQSLLIDFQLVRDGYAGCGHSFENTQDWSGGEGLSFNMQAQDADTWFTVILASGEEGQAAAFEASVQAPAGCENGWQPVSLPWSALQVAAWEEDRGQVFDPARVVGIEFSFSTGTDPFANNIQIGPLQLGAAADDPLPQENAPAAQDPPAAGEEPVQPGGEAGGLRGICPFSTGLPLAAAVMIFFKKKVGQQHASE